MEATTPRTTRRLRRRNLEKEVQRLDRKIENAELQIQLGTFPEEDMKNLLSYYRAEKAFLLDHIKQLGSPDLVASYYMNMNKLANRRGKMESNQHLRELSVAYPELLGTRRRKTRGLRTSSPRTSSAKKAATPRRHSPLTPL
jgi:hypothetical protein